MYVPLAFIIIDFFEWQTFIYHSNGNFGIGTA